MYICICKERERESKKERDIDMDLDFDVDMLNIDTHIDRLTICIYMYIRTIFSIYTYVYILYI